MTSLPCPAACAPVDATTRKRCGLFVHYLFILCIAIASALTPALAQDKSAATDISKTLDTVRVRLDQLQDDLDAAADKPVRDAELVKLRDTAQETTEQAQAAVTKLEPLLSSVQARLAELGEPVEGINEAPDVAAQRKDLSKTASTLDAQIKLARLIDVEAKQASVRILRLRRAQFQAELGQRSDSVLDDAFWNELRIQLPKDINSLQPLWKEFADAAGAQSGRIWAMVLLALAAVVILRLQARRILWRLTTTRVAPGRLRRSLYATAQLTLATIVPGAMAHILHAGIAWQAPLSDELDNVLTQITFAVYFAGFIAGLGRALLSADKPTWRLFPLPDAMASGLRWYPPALAITLAAGWVLQKLATLVNASLAATVAQNCIMTVVLGLLTVLAMRRATRPRRPVDPDPHAIPESPPAASPGGYLFARGLIWLAIWVSAACLILGYIALGSFIMRQVGWSLIVLGTAYLLAGLVEDACHTFLAAIKRHSDDENYTRPMTRLRSQVIVLLTGIARLLILVVALLLLAAPFGDEPTAWLQRLDYLREGVTIGEVQIRPASVIFALLVLLLGFGAVKTVQTWLARQYLPTTSLDPGMRLSAATLFGYAGYVLAVALALSAVGIGLERVAWIASALSVGIGFGLQAVVQNFVSGLILLAERPVKVGDWVTLGGVEGDIRRINVRATEIQMGDRSTVIVPNSEFITKIVRNVTHAGPLGRVQIKLTLPLESNPDAVHDLMLATFADNPGILEDPAPDVMLDGIDAQGMVFNATGYVHSPRVAYTVRSALLFELLRRLKRQGMALSHPPTMVISAPSASSDAINIDKRNPDIPAPGTGSA